MSLVRMFDQAKAKEKWRQVKVKKLKRRIDGFLESTVRGELFYLMNHNAATKTEMYEQEKEATLECFEKHFKRDLEKWCTKEETEQMLSAFLDRARRWHKLVTNRTPHVSNKTLLELENLIETEGQFGNSRRLKELKEIESLYDKYNVRERLDWDVKKYSRYQGWDYKTDGNYYNLNISEHENRQILIDEIKTIASVCSGGNSYSLRHIQLQMEEKLNERAELWYKLRMMGAEFPPEKMKRLAELERNPFGGEGIVRLGQINTELGIIKQDADKIFSEYARKNELKRSGEKVEAKGQDNTAIEHVSFQSPSGMFTFKIPSKRYEEIQQGKEPKTLLERFLVNIEAERNKQKQKEGADGKETAKVLQTKDRER